MHPNYKLVFFNILNFGFLIRVVFGSLKALGFVRLWWAAVTFSVAFCMPAFQGFKKNLTLTKSLFEMHL